MTFNDVLSRRNLNDPKVVRVVVVDSDNKRIPTTRLGQMWKRTKEVTNNVLDWSAEKAGRAVGHVINFTGAALENKVVAGIAIFLGLAACVAAFIAFLYLTNLVGILILIHHGIFWYWAYEAALVAAILMPLFISSSSY